MNKIFGIIILFVFPFFYGCTFKGLTSGYNKLSTQEKKEIVPFQSAKNANSEYDFEMINGKQVLSLVKNDENALVYLWTPHCHSASCKPISFIADRCEARNTKLYVIANEYELKEIKNQLKMNQKIYFLDYHYYNTNSKMKCVKKFIEDILPISYSANKKTLPDSLYYSNYFHFSKGNFIGVESK